MSRDMPCTSLDQTSSFLPWSSTAFAFGPAVIVRGHLLLVEIVEPTVDAAHENLHHVLNERDKTACGVRERHSHRRS